MENRDRDVEEADLVMNPTIEGIVPTANKTSAREEQYSLTNITENLYLRDNSENQQMHTSDMKWDQASDGKYQDQRGNSVAMSSTVVSSTIAQPTTPISESLITRLATDPHNKVSN